MTTVAKANVECGTCRTQIDKGKDMHWGNGGWLHPWCPSSGTYLAEVEDTEGHPMAYRVVVGIQPKLRPECRHGHSRLCAHTSPGGVGRGVSGGNEETGG